MMTNVGTLDALIQQNQALHQKLSQLGLSADYIASIWYTLVGLKLLKDAFDGNKTTWKLVANKARQALTQRLGFTANVEESIGLLSVQIKNF